LRAVDMNVDPGEYVGLIGANEAGDITLITIAAVLRTALTG
jgi:ABC-type polysaccharide/polyol phosphate transport system ATPase subunit